MFKYDFSRLRVFTEDNLFEFNFQGDIRKNMLPPELSSDVDADLHAASKSHLKDICKELRLKSSGTKKELVDRISAMRATQLHDELSDDSLSLDSGPDAVPQCDFSAALYIVMPSSYEPITPSLIRERFPQDLRELHQHSMLGIENRIIQHESYRDPGLQKLIANLLRNEPGSPAVEVFDRPLSYTEHEKRRLLTSQELPQKAYIVDKKNPRAGKPAGQSSVNPQGKKKNLRLAGFENGVYGKEAPGDKNERLAYIVAGWNDANPANIKVYVFYLVKGAALSEIEEEAKRKIEEEALRKIERAHKIERAQEKKTKKKKEEQKNRRTGTAGTKGQLQDTCKKLGLKFTGRSTKKELTELIDCIMRKRDGASN